MGVDKDKNYMREMWGTTSLTSDYGSLDQKTNKRVIIKLKSQILRNKIREYKSNGPCQQKMKLATSFWMFVL